MKVNMSDGFVGNLYTTENRRRKATEIKETLAKVHLH